MERVFETKDGVRVTAINEIQADVYEREGFEEITEVVTEDKKK
jgi:hypothetical protein